MEPDVDWADVPDDWIPVRKLPSGRAERRKAKASRPGFVKGPLFQDWIIAAATCGSDRALALLLVTKAKADTLREDWIKLPRAAMRVLLPNRMGRSRALAALERAGLIEVRKRKGRPSLVRLVPWKGRADG
jgi:hypothetical protein